MKTKKTKRTSTLIVSVLLIVGIIAGAVAALSSCGGRDEDGLITIHPSFEVGGLTETGHYKETETSIYTKERFECEGLKIALDFDAKLTYRVYFFDELDNCTASTDELSLGDEVVVPEGAEYARIVITPAWDDDVTDEDKELGFLDCMKYSGKITVKVAS